MSDGDTNDVDVETKEAMIHLPDRNSELRVELFEEALAQADEQRQILAKYVTKYMLPSVDFGIIPGTQKPTLLKPGAEKLVELFRCVAEYEQTAKVEQWDPPGFFHYEYKCRIRRQDGMTVAEGVGSANSRENRYMRDAPRQCPACSAPAIKKGAQKFGGGWYCDRKIDGCGQKFTDKDPLIVDQEVAKTSEDVYTQVNTILKMAKKRSLVDAAISLARCSDLFTQDVEDMQRPPPPRQGKPQPVPRTAQPAPLSGSGSTPPRPAPVPSEPPPVATGPLADLQKQAKGYMERFYPDKPEDWRIIAKSYWKVPNLRALADLDIVAFQAGLSAWEEYLVQSGMLPEDERNKVPF